MNTNYNKGLSDNEVIYSRKKYGSNNLTKRKSNGFFLLLLESLNDPIIKILLMALAVKLLFIFKESNIYETLGIGIAVFLATFISTLSEYSSEKAFEKLNEANKYLKAIVLRNSIKISIDISEIVVGDIIYISSGDRIQCDGKIIEGNIDVDESSLTGETREKHKDIYNNEIYMGSIITNGNATAIVTSVGDKTYYGNIAASIQEPSLESPLRNRLKNLANIITKFGYIAAIIILLSYLFNAVIIDNNFNLNKIINFKEFIPHLLYGLTLSVAVVVMAVPEGLPMMITLVLSSNMKRMLKKNVLVRKLVGIETAGSLNILFTDKTGTLTDGKLKVSSYVDTKSIPHYSYEMIEGKLRDLVYNSLVYNNSSFFNGNNIEGGNVTDKATLEFVMSDNKTKYRTLNFLPFNSKNKYSMVEIDYDNKTTYIKGAYENIINKCNYYLDEKLEKRVLINKNIIFDEIDKYTSSGYRVLALAISDKFEFANLIYAGFIIMKDNIRANCYEGIQKIKKAKIEVVMVTGDSKETAINIAKSLNIIDSSNNIALSSEEFNNMNDADIIKLLPKLKVLYRSLPQDKNGLIKLSQQSDLIVGMTGDGVNDAPALKRADVGFSMGSGTEVAKETSDIVILDNNINSIATAILYGRTIFKSIRKFITFQLSVNLCAVLLSIVCPFIGILTPITVIQMLWVNMVMDTLAGLAFAYEPALNEYMDEPPKKKKEPILNKYMINQIILNGLYSFFTCICFLNSAFIKKIYSYNLTDRYLYTSFFGLFIFLAIFNAFNSRTYRINILSNILKNKVFLLIIMLIAVIQIILIYYGGTLFRTTGLTTIEFEIMLIISFTIIPFDIIRKSILKKLGKERIL